MLYFQLVIMAGTVMLAYYFECTDTFSVHVQGFFCYDTSYTKPYLGPEDRSAVPPPLLYALVAGLPTLLPPGRGSTVMGGGGIVTVALSAPVRANRKWDKCPEAVTAPAFGDQPPLPFLEQSQCTVLFLVQYTSKEFDRSEKTVATGDCCYLNPLVRRTFRFLDRPPHCGTICPCSSDRLPHCGTICPCIRQAPTLWNDLPLLIRQASTLWNDLPLLIRQAPHCGTICPCSSDRLHTVERSAPAHQTGPHTVERSAPAHQTGSTLWNDLPLLIRQASTLWNDLPLLIRQASTLWNDLPLLIRQAPHCGTICPCSSDSFGLFTVDIFVNAGQVVTGNLAPYFLTVYVRDAHGPGEGNPSGQAGPLSGSGVSGLPHRAEPGRRVPEPLGDVIAGFIIGGAIATFLVVCVVHNFKGKLLLGEESPEHQPGSALLTLGRMESPLEKYIASQTPETEPSQSELCVSADMSDRI
ncbi:hypothetical protein F7725_028422 [Dissostichus mawsoni]|uniref:Uncharacterized protein n=1 Tax=Dissostichus mawsoni TaxID=36200 RepID=A0A7J5XFR0_DISMA|nr:hypothetical protein F7725_028422 [Dissostichus mawsoni]